MPQKKPKTSAAKSWGGRLAAEADAATAELLASLDIDVELWKYDIAGSLAHARMLQEVGLIDADELAAIRDGLRQIEEQLEDGKLDLPTGLEDIHMVIEDALIAIAGDAGRKLHTGRSRNDQVATDLRLWARDAIDELISRIRELQRCLVRTAEAAAGVVIPAYTHLQRAQPVLAGHAVLAYVEMLQRDADRLADARVRTDVCPLGSGAVGGTSLPLNRKRTAELLGFRRISRNGIDATSDRDFLAELCFACSMVATHLSRWAEDWIIYSSTEFGLIELHDAYCTSSSMMPQKKNADALELIRGKSATAIAQLVGMLTLLKGLPMAYGRDLQDDKRFAFPAVEAMRQSLTVAAGVAATARFRRERIAASLDAGFLDATALAEYLTERGAAFRAAHHAVGQLVARAEAEGKTLAELPLAVLGELPGGVGEDVYDCLGAANVVDRYKPDGSGGRRQLGKQLAHWKRALS